VQQIRFRLGKEEGRGGKGTGVAARAEKIFFWAKFTGESCKCTPRQRVHTLKQSKSPFLKETGEMWTVGLGEVI